TAADLCLWVLDASTEPVWPEAGHGAVKVVVNKVDLQPAWDPSQAEGAIRVSAQTGEGIPELCAALSRWLVPDVPPAGAAVPFTDSLCDGIEAARHLPEAGKIEIARGILLRLQQAASAP